MEAVKPSEGSIGPLPEEEKIQTTLESIAAVTIDMDIIKPKNAANTNRRKWWIAGSILAFVAVAAAVTLILRLRIANLQSATFAQARSLTATRQPNANMQIRLEALQVAFDGSTYPFSAELCNTKLRVNHRGRTVSTLQLTKTGGAASSQCVHLSSDSNSFDSDWVLTVEPNNEQVDTSLNAGDDVTVEVAADITAYMGGIQVWDAGNQVLYSSACDVSDLIVATGDGAPHGNDASPQEAQLTDDDSPAVARFTHQLVQILSRFTQYGIIEMDGVLLSGSILLSPASSPRTIDVDVQSFRMVYGSIPKQQSSLLSMGADTAHVLVDCTEVPMTQQCSLPIQVFTTENTAIEAMLDQISTEMMQDAGTVMVHTTLASILPNIIVPTDASSFEYKVSFSVSSRTGSTTFLQLAANTVANSLGLFRAPTTSTFEFGVTLSGAEVPTNDRRLQSLPANVAVQISSPAITVSSALLTASTDVTLSATSPADTLLKVIRTYLLSHPIALSEQLSVQTKLGRSWQPVSVLTSSLATQPSLLQCTEAQLRAGTCNLPIRTTPVVRSSVCGSFDLTVAPVPSAPNDVRVQASFDATSIQNCLQHLTDEYIIRQTNNNPADGYSAAWLFDATHLPPAQEAAISPGGSVHLTLRSRYEVVLPLVVDARTWLIADSSATHVVRVSEPSKVSVWDVHQESNAVAYTTSSNGGTLLHGVSFGIPWQVLAPQQCQCIETNSLSAFCNASLTDMLATYNVDTVAVTASGPCDSLQSYNTAINSLPSIPSLGCASVFVASLSSSGVPQELASAIVPRSLVPTPLQGATFSTPLFGGTIRGLAQWSAVSQPYGIRLVGTLFSLDNAFNSPLDISNSYFQGLEPLPPGSRITYRYSCDPWCVEYSILGSTQPALTAFQDWTARGVSAAIAQFPPSISAGQVANNLLNAINFGVDKVDTALWDIFCPMSQVWWNPTRQCRFPFADILPNAFEFLERTIKSAIGIAFQAGQDYFGSHTLTGGTLSLHLAVNGNQCAADLLLSYTSQPAVNLKLTSNANTALCPNTTSGLNAMYAVLQPTYGVRPANLLVANFNLQATFEEATGGALTSISSNALADVRAALVAVDSGIYEVAQTVLGITPGFPVDSLLTCFVLTCLDVEIITPSPPPQPSPVPSDDSTPESSVGRVVGGVFGGLAGAGLLVALGLVGLSRMRKRGNYSQPEQWRIGGKNVPMVASRNPMVLESP